MKKTFAVMTSVLALSGCASMLDPNGAKGDFSCTDPNNPDAVVDGVTCKTPFAIYKSTHEPAPLKESDLPIGVTLDDYEAEQGAAALAKKKQDDRALMQGVYHGQSYQLPGQLRPEDQAQYARPVRVPATIMRIWFAPWIDANDDLHFPSHVFTEIQPRRWAFGAPEFTGRGMTVPTRQLQQVPANPVGSNDRVAAQEPVQLQPYQSQPTQPTQPTQPIGTGSQMPRLP